MLRKENEKRLKRNQRSPIVTLTTIQPKHQSPRIKPRLWSTAAQVRAGTKPPTNHWTALLHQWHSLSVLCANHATNQKLLLYSLLSDWIFQPFWQPTIFHLTFELWWFFFYELNYLYILLNMYKLTKMLCDMFHILCICKDC